MPGGFAGPREMPGAWTRTTAFPAPAGGPYRGERTRSGGGHSRAGAARGHIVASRSASRRLRIAAITVLAVIAVTLVAFQFTFRLGETSLAAVCFRFFTPVLAASQVPIIWFGLGTAHAFGLEVTPDCSVSLLLVPLCGLGILLLIPRRLKVSLVIRALIVAATLLVIGNTLRLGVIALCVRYWGLGVGYEVGHLVLGSLVSVVAIGLSLVLLTAIVASRSGLEFSAALLPRHRRRRS